LPGNPEAVEAVNRVILDHLDWLRPPELRRALAAEALRHGAVDEFNASHISAQWRTYFALDTNPDIATQRFQANPFGAP
jgi:hypothetical protein